MSANLVGKHVRRYAFMHPREDPKGIHKVKGQGLAGGEEVVWLEGFSGYVHIDAVESIAEDVKLFSASLFKIRHEMSGDISYDIRNTGCTDSCNSEMLFLKDISYEKAKEGLIEYARWRFPFLDTELYV